MRKFFINWSGKLISIFIAMMIAAIAIAGISTIIYPELGGSPIQGLFILLFGGVYAVIVGGMLYLFFGIYRDTQRTNALLEELLRK